MEEDAEDVSGGSNRPKDCSLQFVKDFIVNQVNPITNDDISVQKMEDFERVIIKLANATISKR